ncbi:MAG: hypothetical protein Q4C56_08995 [Peptococcaceae bacterium]|nr:hypothetical protein [Peptococcaceae bacterium]
MGILVERKYLQGKNVTVIYRNGTVISGFWSEWWDADESDWEEGEVPCDTILIEGVKNHWSPSVAIDEIEIQDIQEA